MEILLKGLVETRYFSHIILFCNVSNFSVRHCVGCGQLWGDALGNQPTVTRRPDVIPSSNTNHTAVGTHCNYFKFHLSFLGHLVQYRCCWDRL